MRAKPAPIRAASPVVARSRLPTWVLAFSLVLVTMALYWPATSHDFVNYDDEMYVKDNTHVTSGLTFRNVQWAFRSDYAGNWHPVTWLSHMLDCQLFGLHPWGHHLTSVLLQALNAGLVFVWLRLMTGATGRSVAVAALFSLHPLRVESVAWVSERKDVLSGFFGLLSLMAYARYAQRSVISDQWAVISHQSSGVPAPHNAPRPTDHRLLITDHRLLFYLLSLFFFALGLMSKPMLVTWPLVMLVLDYWPLGRMQNAKAPDTHHAPRTTHHVSQLTAQSQIANRKSQILIPLLVEKIPFLALVVLGSIATFVAQKQGGAVETVENLPLGARTANALISYGRYLGKLFWPADLAAFYPRPGHWPLGKVLLAGGLVLGLTALVWLQRRRHPGGLVGWLWFLGTLVPVIGLVQVGDQAMADRYTYLPSLGVLVLAVWGAYELTRGWRHQLLALSVAGCGTSVLCLALTRQQLGHWQDSEALFRHAIEVTKDNYLAYNNLGAALAKKDQLDEAIRLCQEAIRIKPGFADAYNNLGAALGKKHQTDEAIRQYQEAVHFKPDNALAHYNLGAALSRKGQADEAIRQFQEAIRLNPDYAEAHNNLGVALGGKGQTDEAIRQFQQAVRLNPDNPEAHNNLGVALGKKGRTGEAIQEYQEIIRLKPDYADAHNNLGIALYQQGRAGEAIREFQEALRLKPDYADARRNLNSVLATKAGSLPAPGTSTNR